MVCGQPRERSLLLLFTSHNRHPVLPTSAQTRKPNVYADVSSNLQVEGLLLVRKVNPEDLWRETRRRPFLSKGTVGFLKNVYTKSIESLKAFCGSFFPGPRRRSEDGCSRVAEQTLCQRHGGAAALNNASGRRVLNTAPMQGVPSLYGRGGEVPPLLVSNERPLSIIRTAAVAARDRG